MMVDTVNFMHERNIILYDLSPCNWILSNLKELIYTDFDQSYHFTEKTNEPGVYLNLDI